MKIALVGNQNCGKTTLFNALTGSNQHVGNFPGVTVDSKVGLIKGMDNYQLIDLPGIYSIRPYSAEEIVTRDCIINDNPDCILNIIDAMNIERNLYLSLQIIELNKPTVIALNMMDELRDNGGTIDIVGLSNELGVPVVPISAINEEGISELISVVEKTAIRKIKPLKHDFCSPGAVHRCIHSISHIVEDHADKIGIAARFVTMQVLLKDKHFIELSGLDQNELEIIDHHIIEMEQETGLDYEAAIADMRYTFIEEVCHKTVKKPVQSKERLRSEKIDRILTNKYLSIPLFILIMIAIFYLTFGLIGPFLQDLLANFIDSIGSIVDTWLTDYGISSAVHSLVIEGIFTGVGSVLSFLPVVVTLFFFLSILEDTGYMARIAFVMDKLLRKIGLSGKSIVPLLIGFGCSVPAVMSTRTLTSERDRKMTMMLVPFMSCSAKIPIYSVFAMAFFPGAEALVMCCLYFGGIIVSILFALILNMTIFKGKSIPFVLELPNYRMPSFKSVILLMWEKARDFIERAFTVIFVVTIIIWFLSHFNSRFYFVKDTSLSLLAIAGKALVKIFIPLGINDWRVVTSLIGGFTAKEAVVTTLAVLLSVSEDQLVNNLSGLFTIASSCSFLAFTLLYTPCVAAVSAIRREFDSLTKTILIVIVQCSIAWIVALCVYNLVTLFA